MLNLSKEGLKDIIKINDGNLNKIIELINLLMNKDEVKDILDLFEELNIEVRSCSVCNKLMLKGYCIEDGYDYACSDDCLKELFTSEEIKGLDSDGDGEFDVFYTEWTEVDEKGQAYGGICNVI